MATVNPLVKALQLPDGMTVRKVKGVLKVVKARKVAIVEKVKAMPKQISVSIHPFGAYREQIWIGKVVDGEFVKDQLLYKVVQAGNIIAKKSYNGKFGKASTSEDWEITVPDNFADAIAKGRLSDPSFTKRETVYEVL